MRDDDFEWDDRKAASNLRKHRVRFELARFVFDDPIAIDELDEGEDEERFQRIGMASGRLLLVVYALRGRRNRIISARRANNHEQDKYIRRT